MPAPAASGASRPSLRVKVTGLRSSRGMVRCSVFANPDGFPGEAAKAHRQTSAPIAGTESECVFDNLPSGDYAVAFLHDENANGRMDTNFFGLPKEGYGASNDARGRFGPPSFKDARFRYPGGPWALRLTVAY